MTTKYLILWDGEVPSAYRLDLTTDVIYAVSIRTMPQEGKKADLKAVSALGRET